MLLEALLAEPGRDWTRTELASVARLHAKARMDLHLRPLVVAGLLARHNDHYSLETSSELAVPLRRLLNELGASLPDS